MTGEAIQKQINVLRRRRDELQAELSSIDDELGRLHLLRDQEEFNCPCVRINGDIGIGDMHEQDRRRRTGLTLGWVSRTLSASLDCPLCLGKGRKGSK